MKAYTKQEKEELSSNVKDWFETGYYIEASIHVEFIDSSRTGSNDYYKVFVITSLNEIYNMTFQVAMCTGIRYNDAKDCLSVGGGGYSKKDSILRSIKQIING